MRNSIFQGVEIKGRKIAGSTRPFLIASTQMSKGKMKCSLNIIIIWTRMPYINSKRVKKYYTILRKCPGCKKHQKKNVRGVFRKLFRKNIKKHQKRAKEKKVRKCLKLALVLALTGISSSYKILLNWTLNQRVAGSNPARLT